MIYEIINPSDACTCKAESLSVAAFCVIMLSPNMGVRNVEDEGDGFFAPFGGAVVAFRERWGDGNEFYAAHVEEIAACWESYAYGDAGDRTMYDKALELIDDPDKREQFRLAAEDKARTSMNKIVLAAWENAKRIRKAVTQ